MVTRYPSISTRKLSNALKILTSNKCMVAISDYDEFHKMAKRCLLTNVLGGNAQVNLLIQLSRAFTVSLYMLYGYFVLPKLMMCTLCMCVIQKRHRIHRDTMMENMSTQFHAHIKDNPLQLVNFRKIFESELFAVSMKQVS